jgi:hypothetical protein
MEVGTIIDIAIAVNVAASVDIASTTRVVANTIADIPNIVIVGTVAKVVDVDLVGINLVVTSVIASEDFNPNVDLFANNHLFTASIRHAHHDSLHSTFSLSLRNSSCSYNPDSPEL